MKKAFFLFMCMFIANYGFNQNVIYLKNGDKMNGKLAGYHSDTILFNLQGNVLKFCTSDLLAIYFDANLSSTNVNFIKQNNEIEAPKDGRLYGVITYYFNYNFGNKPDVGAEVYAAKSDSVPDEFKENSMWFWMQAELIDKGSKPDTYVKRTVVDGVGSYSLNLEPGTYTVLIKSKHRKGYDNINEVLGKNHFVKIIIKSGAEFNLSHNFREGI